jgi:hypothetical protein
MRDGGEMFAAVLINPHPEEAAQRPSRRMATSSVFAAILRDASFGRSSG